MIKYNGLTQYEVDLNQKKYGLNELVKEKRSNFFIIYLKQFSDWLVIILIIAALISLIVDKNSLFESMVILTILLINALIGATQEIKAFKTLDGLKKLSNHQVKVIRDKKVVCIEPRYLTIDDIVVLEKGNMIDADMVIIESNNLEVDESVLTGESIPIIKKNGDFLYSGTFIIKGNVTSKVNRIGMDSKIGLIAKELSLINEEMTPLEIKLGQIGKIIGLIAIFICLIVFLIELMLKISLIEAFKSSVSLAVAAIPEGLATVVTVCLAIGVRKMANQNAIIKKLSCVETLGCSNIICTDKTGTLTENKQKVMVTYFDKSYSLNEFSSIDKRYLDYLYISSKLDMEEVTDPIDLSILNMLNNLKYKENEYRIINIKPFDSNDKYMSVEFMLDGKNYFIYKGALDVLIGLGKKTTIEINDFADKMMEKGYRVIAISNDNNILGVLAMQDPPRKDVLTTISLAKTSGLKTIMITGDHAKTAFTIAHELNIATSINEVLTKEELDKLSDKELDQNIDKYNVYARVNPLDKLRIINSWQRRNMIVAMTGDGINDAIALKKADIGCAMGSGAEISKDSADIIFTDSNYNTIIKAVKNGRVIYENIKKCTKYLLSSNIGEVLTIFIVLLLSLITKINLSIPLLSIHLLWINLITDSLPAFGLGIMNPTDDIMKLPPRKKDDSFFDKKMIFDILFMGTVIGLITIISYFIGLNINPIYAQTMAFFTLSTSQLIHSYNCSAERSIFNRKILMNKFLNLSFVVGMILQFSVIYISGLNSLFRLKPLPINMLLASILLAISVLIISEFKKKVELKRNNVSK